MIAAIACVDYNYAIGYKNQLLVSIEEDLKRFKALTSDENDPTKNIVIMGRKTWESLPKKPLKNRINWIITQHPIKYQTMEYQDNHVHFMTLEDVKHHLSHVYESPQKFWVIGGGFIYRELLPYCDHVYITFIHHTFKADTYFSFDSKKEWQLYWRSGLNYDNINDMNYHFAIYTREYRKDDDNIDNTHDTDLKTAAWGDGKLTQTDGFVSVDLADGATNHADATLSTLNATVDPDKINSIIPSSTTKIPPDYHCPIIVEPPTPLSNTPSKQIEKAVQDVLKDVTLTNIENAAFDAKAKQVFDDVERPKHYTDGNIEVIDFIEDKKLGFCLGNVVKYVARAGKKKSGNLDDKKKEIQDLKKAKWYLNRRIYQLEQRLCCP